MRHRVAGRHLGRDTAHRLALYRNLVTELLRHERITTTEAKAKEIRPLAEKMITLGKRGDLHARRQALAFIYDPKVVRKLFAEIAPRMKDRNGGYVRITKLERRLGDGAPMAAIELVDLAPPAERPRRRPQRPQPAAASRAPAASAPAAARDAVTPAEEAASSAEAERPENSGAEDEPSAAEASSEESKE
jgi:large subunit ribosomal protein L17